MNYALCKKAGMLLGMNTHAFSQATIMVSGNLTECALARIDARLVPVAAGSGGAGPNQASDTGWQVIANAPQGSTYQGTLTARGGWYELRMRAIRSSGLPGSEAAVSRVGIGEVFGQAGLYTATVSNVYGCSGQGSVQVQVISEYVSRQTGEWNNPATWQSNCPDCLPTPATSVRIEAGHTVSVPQGLAVRLRNYR